MLLVIAMLVSIMSLGLSAYTGMDTGFFNDKQLPEEIRNLPSMRIEGEGNEFYNTHSKDFTDGGTIVTRTVTISAIEVTPDVEDFVWESSHPVLYVFVKGGAPEPGSKLMSTLYSYDPAAYHSDDGLPPLRSPKGSLSHITFYFGEAPPSTGSITVAKLMDEEMEPGDQAGPFRFKLTYPDGETTETSDEIHVTDGSMEVPTVTFDNLQQGTYHLEELLPEGTGTTYELVGMEKDGVTMPGNGMDVTVSDEEGLIQFVTVTNREVFVPRYGIQIEKSLLENSVDTEEEFDITVYRWAELLLNDANSLGAVPDDASLGDASGGVPGESVLQALPTGGWLPLRTVSVKPGETDVLTTSTDDIGSGQYAVRETGLANGFELVDVKVNGNSVTPVPDTDEGYYPFSVPEANGEDVLVHVEVVNFKEKVTPTPTPTPTSTPTPTVTSTPTPTVTPTPTPTVTPTPTPTVTPNPTPTPTSTPNPTPTPTSTPAPTPTSIPNPTPTPTPTIIDNEETPGDAIIEMMVEEPIPESFPIEELTEEVPLGVPLPKTAGLPLAGLLFSGTGLIGGGLWLRKKR